MSRPKKNYIKKFDLLSSIKESFDSIIRTDFKIVDYGDYFSCEFYSKNGNKYDLEFHYVDENSDMVLNNGLTLGDVLNTSKNQIECLDIAFTLSSITDKDNPKSFAVDTNIKEQFDVFGRIVFILKTMIKRFNTKKYNVFIIGGDARRNRLTIYKKLFYKHFKDYFDVYEGRSEWHGDGSLFIIKNNK